MKFYNQYIEKNCINGGNMANLTFRYGAMNASKSIQLLMTAHNYKQSGKRASILTPAIDDRYGVGKVTSRVGLSQEAVPIYEDTNLYEVIGWESPDIALIDEGQFLLSQHVGHIVKVVDELNIPVTVYGLLKDFKNTLFEGSKILFCEADVIEEIKTVCYYCNNKATHILKFKNGNPVFSGGSIEIGGNDTYKSVCRKHWYITKGDI